MKNSIIVGQPLSSNRSHDHNVGYISIGIWKLFWPDNPNGEDAMIGVILAEKDTPHNALVAFMLW